LTKVFFYHGAADKLAAACHLLGKAHAHGKTMLVYAPSDEQAQQIDRLLWTYSALGFVPHCRADSPLAAETPIVIASRPEQLQACERLMNLGPEMPPDLGRFPHLIEVVGQDDEDRQPARRRFREYKAQGLEIDSFDLAAKGS
jgi:DNA polymerase III subunit chi